MSHLSINITDKSYSQQPLKQVIKNLQLDLYNHEFVCLVGKSGCGKTTLLNILAGLDDDYTGHISLDNTHNPKIGYVFQNPNLLPWRTVTENIQLAAKPDAKTLAFLLANMGLSAEKDSYPEHLSLGMQRRVSIIRAFANQPDLLLMDEPFVSLDSPTARQVRQLLIDLWQQRPHKVLFVTHDLREAITLADRLIFLDSQPMAILADVKVSLAREQRQQDSQIDSFKQRLFIDYPQIKHLL